MSKWKTNIIFLLCIPVILILGTVVFGDKQYAFISLALVLLSCLPFFMSFERKAHSSAKLILISIMVALSVVGRIIFAALPSFKPVSAMIIITAMYFGKEAGFMTGALTAVISNFYLGQGPWTPFQMFAWGLVGFIAGVFAANLKANKIILLIYGAIAGVLFSLLMDLWSVLWVDGWFNLSRYIVMIASSFTFTAIYAVSNIIFLLIFAKPIGRKLERIKEKYDL